VDVLHGGGLLEGWGFFLKESTLGNGNACLQLKTNKMRFYRAKEKKSKKYIL